MSDRTWEEPKDPGTSTSTVHSYDSKTEPDTMLIIVMLTTITTITGITIVLLTCKDLQCPPSL